MSSVLERETRKEDSSTLKSGLFSLLGLEVDGALVCAGQEWVPAVDRSYEGIGGTPHVAVRAA